MGIEAYLQEKWWIWLLLTLWVIPWKGVALWKAARNGQKWWFVALLVVNTLAILEITYIFYFSKKPKMAPSADSSGGQA